MRRHDITEPYGGRGDSLKRMVPDLFDHDTVLYVGAHSGRFDVSPLQQPARSR